MLLISNIAFQLDQIQMLDEETQRRMTPFQKEVSLIQTIPGINKTSAAAIIAEIGVEYIDPGAEEVNQRNAQAREQTIIRSLERLGYTVTKIAA